MRVSTPISQEETRNLKVGDIVFLDGVIFTLRDMAHKRAIETVANSEKLPFNLERRGIYHCGPIVKEVSVKGANLREKNVEEDNVREDNAKNTMTNDTVVKDVSTNQKKDSCNEEMAIKIQDKTAAGKIREVISAGPTTSSRMSGFTPELVKRTDPALIIGKGGMNSQVSDILAEKDCIYLAFTGGAAVIAAQGIKMVRNVYWEDMGMAEAVWEFEVNNFGPLVVAMDSHGNSLYDRVNSIVQRKKNEISEHMQEKKDGNYNM